jgi:hypothetical protein
MTSNERQLQLLRRELRARRRMAQRHARSDPRRAAQHRKSVELLEREIRELSGAGARERYLELCTQYGRLPRPNAQEAFMKQAAARGLAEAARRLIRKWGGQPTQPSEATKAMAARPAKRRKAKLPFTSREVFLHHQADRERRRGQALAKFAGKLNAAVKRGNRGHSPLQGMADMFDAVPDSKKRPSASS